jgi:non-ribosomal peptide synthetase component F
VVPSGAADGLLRTGRAAGASPYVVFLTLWAVVVGRAGGGWDIGIAAPHAGRLRPELHDVVGPLIDVVVIRPRLAPELTFAEAVARVEHACREGFARHAVPFEIVADALAGRDPSRTPLYQTMVTLSGDGMVGQHRGERDLEVLAEAWTTASTDVSLAVWPNADGSYGGAVEYATALYDAATATGLARQVAELAAHFAADATARIGAELAAPSRTDTILTFIRDLLQQQDIGPQDDFMRLGGNSLLAARLLWSVQETYDVEVSMRVLFDQPTAAALATEVERLSGDVNREEEGR